jgi:iron complex outermembrane receptor protein
MFRRTKVCTAALVALGGVLGSGVAPVFAQAQPAQLERVEITGSAIRRIQAEGAQPVQVIRRDEIERSGATSVSDLIQQLPSMQNFTNEGTSVGGGGNGFSGASIHNLGETRTLVLLNGRRLAQFAGQNITGSLAGIDLNTIPIASIERVEILTDGASALYGADAVGGVINFITRRTQSDAEITAGFSTPQGGGKEQRLSFSKGFGNIDSDGFNVTLGANLEKRTKLPSTARDFSKTGVISFNLDGRNVSFFNGSPRGIPGNVTHDAGTPGDTSDDYLVSPYYLANGSCPADHVALLEGPTTPACYYDYVTQLEILPERERGAFLGQFSVKLGGDHTLYGELLASSTKNTNRIAPPPGEVLIDPSSPFWPTVLAVNPGATLPAVVPYRVADVGKRTQTDKTDAQHLVVGVGGLLAGWDYDTSLTHSVNKQASSLGGGYVKLAPFFAALDSGLVNPFVSPGNQSPAAQQALDDSRILGFWEGGRFTLDVIQARGSRELMKLDGGNLAVAAGVAYSKEKFQKSASQIARGIGDNRFGDDAAIIPYVASRSSTGFFGELVAPVAKGLELTGSLRHDNYSDFGGATTAKFSARYQPTSALLLRGSIGTGFKAPTVPQTSATRQQFGVTSGNYTCTPDLAAIAANLGANCPTGNVQYNVYAEGNKELKPEKSNQWTLGFRVEPESWLSAGADLWQVKLKNQIGQVDEAIIFGDPNNWTRYWTSYTDPGTNQVLLALFQPNDNLGDNTQRGIDLDARVRFATPVGRLTTQLTATYWLKDSYQLQLGGPFLSSLGKYGPDGNVTFRWQGKVTATLEQGAFVHSLGVNFKSGYKDQAYSADDFAVFDPLTFEPFDYNGDVKTYSTLDWQTQWKASKALTLTAGVLNVFDQAPPRSLKSSGGGQQIGYDDRYYDPRGRTLYANLSFKF